METTTTQTYTIDAAGKRLGIVATEAASILLGKHSPEFARHTVFPVRVEVTNARLMDITEKKRGSEVYKSYSGYPGGQRVETLGHLAGRRGYAEVLARTVSGMLPKNKLRSPRLKNLSVTE